MRSIANDEYQQMEKFARPLQTVYHHMPQRNTSMRIKRGNTDLRYLWAVWSVRKHASCTIYWDFFHPLNHQSRTVWDTFMKWTIWYSVRNYSCKHIHMISFVQLESSNLAGQIVQGRMVMGSSNSKWIMWSDFQSFAKWQQVCFLALAWWLPLCGFGTPLL